MYKLKFYTPHNQLQYHFGFILIVLSIIVDSLAKLHLNGNQNPVFHINIYWNEDNGSGKDVHIFGESSNYITIAFL